MDRDFYNFVNEDVNRDKDIQKATGVSPAQEKWKTTQGGVIIGYKPTIEGWRTGWRIKITRSILEDYMGMDLGMPPFYLKGRYDYNCAVAYYYPFPIALLTALRVWLKYQIQDTIQTLISFQRRERRIRMKLEDEYKRGYQEGRDFEFKSMLQREYERLNDPRT